MLEALGHEVAVVTPYTLLRHLMDIVEAQTVEVNLANYLLEIACVHFDLMTTLDPMTIAAAALHLARQILYLAKYKLALEAEGAAAGVRVLPRRSSAADSATSTSSTSSESSTSSSGSAAAQAQEPLISPDARVLKAALNAYVIPDSDGSDGSDAGPDASAASSTSSGAADASSDGASAHGASSSGSSAGPSGSLGSSDNAGARVNWNQRLVTGIWPAILQEKTERQSMALLPAMEMILEARHDCLHPPGRGVILQVRECRPECLYLYLNSERGPEP